MAKIQYKIYQSPRSLGANPVYYGLVLNQSLSAEESLRQIMAEKKITAFQPSQLLTLIDSVLQGAIELTARDGIPRSISSLLRTHLAWDKGFTMPDSSPKSTPMSVRVRLLKDLRLPVDMNSFEFVPADPIVLPKIERIFPAGATTAESGLVSLSRNIQVQGERLNGDSESSITYLDARIVTTNPESGSEDESLLEDVAGNTSWYRREFSWGPSPAAVVGTKGYLKLFFSQTTATGSTQSFFVTRDIEVVA